MPNDITQPQTAGDTHDNKPDEVATQAARRAIPDGDKLVRAENEDDDGYDPYSDRLPKPSPLFEQDPWD